ncbi:MULTISPECIES: hypothetical protein [Burkholderiaceae]|uniref:hypothetical protein n=1 Tax=Burkholderiaceae TaxID=119060 RepID=UPI001F03A10F|nr:MULTISPECIES: hypothetical protein [Burkholderiaceae]
MIDEKPEPVGLGDPLDAEVFLQLAEVHIRVAGEVVCQHEVRLDHHFIARRNRIQARCTGHDFFGDCGTHGLSSE